jgi:uncharacterized protein (TIGR00251 family)
MIGIQERPEGCILPVHAQPGAKKSRLVGEHGGALKVAVTARASDGRANQALVEILQEALALARGQIELLSGHTSRQKRFLIRGIGKADLQQRLDKQLE